MADYEDRNLETWERTATEYETRNSRALAREGGKAWGVFRIPERTLRLLGPVRGRRILELGCGAADWSIALARMGADVVGLDFSEARLDQARARAAAAGLDLRLVKASAEEVPYPSRSFDVVLSDYGATTFADPYRFVPEVARVLRKGGSFIFAHASPIRTLSYSRSRDRQTRTLRGNYFTLHRLEFPESTEFQLPYGKWIDLFGSNGLTVERLVEPRAPVAWRSPYLSRSDQDWSNRLPYDSIWKLRRASG